MKSAALLLAGTHSGCGKTTVTLGLMAALKKQGLAVRPFKCGPDFIDPSLHRMVCNRPSYNLDCRMCGEDFVRASFARHSADGLAVVEGVMGLFDGGEGSAAYLAKTLGVPVILVVDVRSQAESVAALVHGFASFDPDLPLAGLICNRVGSPRHEALIREALSRLPEAVPLLGFVPRDAQIAIPSRHLGLVMGEEKPLDRAALDRLATLLTERLDMGRLLEIAESAAPPDRINKSDLNPQSRSASQPVRIGVARDAAFCFYYEDNLELLQRAGAELVFFSPLADTRLPENLGGLYLGGGYPELFAEQLAANTGMRQAVRDFSEAGAPLYAECGGFMYLCARLCGQEGDWPMTGIFPCTVGMNGRLRRLGYRELAQMRASFFGPAGMRLFGHEFHYSDIVTDAPELARIWRSTESGAEEGFTLRNTLAGYMHLHWGRTPAAVAAFVETCRAFQESSTPA